LSFPLKYDCNVAFTIPHKLNKFITTGKDHIDRLSCNDVVYKINCKDCDSSYVGQTKRQLKTRVSEHRADITKPLSPSVISVHRIEENHEFDWENVEILDKEPSFVKRSISEMLYIKRQHRGLNKQSDTELLSEVYLPILDRISTRVKLAPQYEKIKFWLFAFVCSSYAHECPVSIFVCSPLVPKLYAIEI
jgi:hypothetical protein